MENQKNQSSLANSVDSSKPLVCFCPKSPYHADKNDEITKNGNFSVKEDSRNVEDKQKEVDDLIKSSPSYSYSSSSDDDDDDSDYVASDDGVSLSNQGEWLPFEAKPIRVVEPESNFQRYDEETTKAVVTPIEPFVNQTIKVGAALVNLGDTCFLNAVLQCFMHTVPLFHLIVWNDHSSPCDSFTSAFCVLCVFRELIGYSSVFEGGSISPLRLVDNLSYFSSSFCRYRQEDAHEFMQCFLNRLESRCNDIMLIDRAPSQRENIVKLVFGGRLVSKLSCCICGHNSNTYEPLIDVSLEIKDVDSLHSALESFTRAEKLDDPEIKFSCEKCKAQVSIEKQLLFDSPPSVAAFHLKRFRNEGSVVQKVDKHVSFPLELDLLPYTNNNQTNNEEMKYDLYAVIVHAGFTSSSGHYYSFIRPAPNAWYKFDDSEVSQVHEDLVLTEDAYIMFYAKRGTLWYSDFAETLINTFPKSVLDNVDTIPILRKERLLDNADTIPILCKERHSVVSDVSESNVAADETVQASNPGPTGAINSSDFHELNTIADNELKETVQTSTPGPPSAINSSNYHAYGVDGSSLTLQHKEDNASQEIGVIERMASLLPHKTPSRSSSPERYRVDFPDQVSRENQLQMDPEEDTEIKLACSLNKKRISGSSGEELMVALRGSDDEGSLNEKKRKTEVFHRDYE